MKTFINSIKHYFKHIFKGFLKYNKSECIDDKARIIISFTTLPSRFDNIRKSLSSLIYQTKIVDEIVISIPLFSKREEVEYKIPDFVNEIINKVNSSQLFIKFPQITILKSEIDWGPATKFIPVLKREKNKGNDQYLLIVLDDDQIYQRTMVSNFIKYYRKHKGCVICNRGRKLDSSMLYSNSCVVLGTKINSVKEVDIITGVGAYMLDPALIDSSLWDYSNAPEGAFYMDDIWISGYFAKKRIKRYVIPSQSEILYRSRRDSHQSRVFKKNKDQENTITLSDIKCQHSENPREFYNNQLIDYFKEYWSLS